MGLEVAHSPLVGGGQYEPSNTKHLYSIYTILDQRRRRWAGVVQMLYNCFVLAGELPYKGRRI